MKKPFAVRVRNLRFDPSTEAESPVPRWWMPRRARSVTTYLDTLSLFFPLGERFFIASVRAHEGSVKDPDLLRDVRAFIGQEGVHAREHQRYNERLRREGYPVEAFEVALRDELDRGRRDLPPIQQLAVTCALEHFTATMGHAVLADPRVLEGAHPTMAALWRWHSAEENEHRSVAFDVYTAAGGTYVRRVLTMPLVTITFWSQVIAQQARMMAHDGTATSPREWFALLHYLFVDPGGMATFGRDWLRYFARDFHPSQMPGGDLAEAWAREPAAVAAVVATAGA